MKSIYLFLTFVFFGHNIYAQQSKNVLIGKVYTKSASANISSTLRFKTETSGISEGVSIVLGKSYVSKISFTYKISGNLVAIVYENSPESEEYSIDLKAGKLISTHLQGYVDDKWGKIFWTEKL
jgi:hypothetical protein